MEGAGSLTCASALVSVLLAAGCGSNDDGDPAPAAATAATAAKAAANAPALAGRWERTQTCDELVGALGRERLSRLAAGVAVDFFPQRTARQLSRKANVCAGAHARPHSHFFTPEGLFGSVDDRGRKVDDGRYRIIDEHHVRIGDAAFRYSIDGDTLTLRPVITAADRRRALRHPLAFSRAGWQVAVTYDGLPWKRVACDGWC